MGGFKKIFSEANPASVLAMASSGVGALTSTAGVGTGVYGIVENAKSGNGLGIASSALASAGSIFSVASSAYTLYTQYQNAKAVAAQENLDSLSNGIVKESVVSGFFSQNATDTVGATARGKESNIPVFAIDIDNIECGEFQNCEGLNVHTDLIEIEEGGENSTTRKFYGDTHYDNVKLYNGITSGRNQLLSWLQSTVTLADRVKPRTASIILKEHVGGREIKRWDLTGVIPVKWSLPTNSKKDVGKNSAVVIESIEFAIEKFEVRDNKGN